MKTSGTASPLTSAVRRGFFLLFTASLLLLSPSLFADALYNFTDFADFANEWLQSCTSGNGWCNGFDYDISGTVDVEDLLLFSNLWLTSKDNLLSDDIAKWTVEQGYTKGLDTVKWNYDRGFILLSLYEKWQSRPNPIYLEFIKNWVDTIIQPDGSIVPGDEDYYQITNLHPRPYPARQPPPDSLRALRRQ